MLRWEKDPSVLNSTSFFYLRPASAMDCWRKNTLNHNPNTISYARRKKKKEKKKEKKEKRNVIMESYEETFKPQFMESYKD
jgi:nitrate reductase alpha subunit